MVKPEPEDETSTSMNAPGPPALSDVLSVLCNLPLLATEPGSPATTGNFESHDTSSPTTGTELVNNLIHEIRFIRTQHVAV